MNPENLFFIASQKLAKIIAILLATWASQRIIILSLKKLRRQVKRTKLETVAQQRQRVRTITSLLINSTKIITNFIALLLIISELGFNIMPLITGVGILGLAVGMGAKTLVSDLIAGFFILLENQFNVGDWIKVGSIEGKVVKISLRTIILKDKEANLHIIPNSSLKIITKISAAPKFEPKRRA